MDSTGVELKGIRRSEAISNFRLNSEFACWHSRESAVAGVYMVVLVWGRSLPVIVGKAQWLFG